jgi:S-(hydroxymethyl)glutathione dehydrogenase/alcohol dehydrogenase
MVTAAVLNEVGDELVVHHDVELAPPGPGEVRVRVVASGVCHSDLSVQNGTIPMPTPIVLGHEGAGIVEEVGPGASRLQPGDHVVLSFVPACGSCFYCDRDQGFLCEKSAMSAMGGLVDGTTRFSLHGQPLRQMAMCGTFGNYAVVPEISAVKIDDDVDLRFAALIGCGVLTGVGAALNTASIRPGDAVAVVGCGGVGLNVIQGAKIAGATRIIAIDRFESKLEMAERFGATDLVAADDGDPVDRVRTLTDGRGADVAFEVIGLGPTIDQALNMTRNGGETILVGVPRLDVVLTLSAAFTFLYLAKTVKGCWYGSSNVHRDVPKLVQLYKEGKLMLEELVSREIGVDGVNEAFTAMESGEVARSLITHVHSPHD